MGWVGPGLLVSMALLLGVLNSFDTPLRQSLISVFVERREDLPNALALNAMLFNTGRFIGRRWQGCCWASPRRRPALPSMPCPSWPCLWRWRR
jgi:hypothetical protein